MNPILSHGPLHRTHVFLFPVFLLQGHSGCERWKWLSCWSPGLGVSWTVYPAAATRPRRPHLHPPSPSPTALAILSSTLSLDGTTPPQDLSTGHPQATVPRRAPLLKASGSARWSCPSPRGVPPGRFLITIDRERRDEVHASFIHLKRWAAPCSPIDPNAGVTVNEMRCSQAGSKPVLDEVNGT